MSLVIVRRVILFRSSSIGKLNYLFNLNINNDIEWVSGALDVTKYVGMHYCYCPKTVFLASVTVCTNCIPFPKWSNINTLV